MSLATRCTACGTVFRVVQDQLKVSEGWVRCGRCDEVFNALEGLFDLEREPPPPGPLTAASSASKPGVAAAPAGGQDEDNEEWPLTAVAERWDPTLADRIGAEFLSVRPGEPGARGRGASASRAETAFDFAHARWDAELLTDEAALLPSAEQEADGVLESMRADAHRPPEFLRHAELRARWRHPKVRLLLGGAALFLAATLSLQAAHHFRDTVAVKWPSTRSALQAWCSATNCSLQAPRRIEDITVESTTLARAGNPADAFRLSVNLRNHGALPLSVPSVDLKLTDGSGALIARRMLSPRDFGATVAALQPGSETSLQLLLSTGNRGVAGYTVEVFYP